MSSLTPQEKKRLSYARDRRNTYGENSKSSRKAIPLRKKKGRRSYRKATNQLLPRGVDASVLNSDESIESKINSVKKDPWRKSPDVPLGDYVQRQKLRRVGRFRRKEQKQPIPEVSGAFISVPNTVDHEGILRAKKR